MDTSKRVSAWWAAAFAVLVAALLLAFAPAKAYADLPVRNTDVSAPASDCIFVGVEGEFLYPSGGQQAALNRINQIRKEAYDEGLVDRYNPIKWSSDLQNIAMTRAAEESIFLGHKRPNGRSLSGASSNGVGSSSENLAWNYSGMMEAIEQWYEEKYDYVNKTGGVTGHYTSMINPNYNFIGMGSFWHPYAYYRWVATAAEFSSRTGLNQTMSTQYGDCMQVIEYKPSYFSPDITLYQDTVPRTLKSGETKTLSAYADCAYGPELPVLAGLNWMSTNPSAVTVDGSGNIKAVASGSATIWATCNGSDADLSWKFDVVKTISVKKNLTTNTREQNGKVTVESLKDEAVGKGGTLTMVATQDGTPATKYPVVGKTTAFKVTSNPGCTLKSFYVTYTENGVKKTLTNGNGLTRVGDYKPSANTYEFTVPDADDVTIYVAWDRAVTSINKTLTCGAQTVYNQASTDGGTCEMVKTQSGISATLYPTVGGPTAFKVTNKDGYVVKAFNVTYTDKATGKKKTLTLQNNGLTRVGDYKPTANTYEFKVPDAKDVCVNVTWVKK